MSSFFLPAATLWQRELIRFWRQKSRLIGVIASPLVIWLLIGYGSNTLGRFFSGALVLTVMFSAIFSTISIIEDRREGFLLSMLVSPAPRTSMVLGKILGSAAWMRDILRDMPARGWVKLIMRVNPLTYAISLLNHTLGLPNITPGGAESLLVTLGFGLGLLLLCGMMATQKTTRSAA